MKLSDALEGFLLFKAATASTNTVKEYRYSLNMWVEFLVDTGVRASELCDLNIGDVDKETGAVQVRHGKGNKPRTVYIGAVKREAIWRNRYDRPICIHIACPSRWPGRDASQSINGTAAMPSPSTVLTDR